MRPFAISQACFTRRQLTSKRHEDGDAGATAMPIANRKLRTYVRCSVLHRLHSNTMIKLLPPARWNAHAVIADDNVKQIILALQVDLCLTCRAMAADVTEGLLQDTVKMQRLLAIDMQAQAAGGKGHLQAT